MLLQVMLLARPGQSSHHHHHRCSCQKGSSSCLLAAPAVRARGGCLCVCVSESPTGHQDTGDVVVHLPGVLLLALVLAESTQGGW